MSMAKRALDEAEEREAALWRSQLVPMTAGDRAWFVEHPHERELFRHRRPGEFDALAEEVDLVGVTVVPVGGGLARIYPEELWRFSDG